MGDGLDCTITDDYDVILLGTGYVSDLGEYDKFWEQRNTSVSRVYLVRVSLL
jgi:hypothetical protein